MLFRSQAARSAAVAAVLWWGGKLPERSFRRLQLACATSGSLGLLIRPHAMRHQPSWADVRLLVEPVVEHVIGGPATAVRNSGWGLHFHLRVAPELGAEKELLSNLAARAIAEINRRVATKAQHLYQLDWLDAFDNTGAGGKR